jgi:hypothetical protein
MITIPVSVSEGHIFLVVEKRVHRRIFGVERNETAAC